MTQYHTRYPLLLELSRSCSRPDESSNLIRGRCLVVAQVLFEIAANEVYRKEANVSHFLIGAQQLRPIRPTLFERMRPGANALKILLTCFYKPVNKGLFKITCSRKYCRIQFFSVEVLYI